MTGWAIIGTGVVSSRFAAGLGALGEAARIISVASRDPMNAKAFAARHGGTPAGYQEAIAMPGVEAVYIATPPALHEAHAMMAIAAGRAVLIEKPFAADAEAAARIITAASAAGVFCMEAMWTRFMPMIAEAKAQIGAGVLGEIRALSGSFMGSDVPAPGTSLFDPARSGGALLHRGIYPLSLARMLLGSAELAAATARTGETGVDEDCTLVLRHGSGAISTIRASLRAPGPNRLAISGTLGMFELEAPVFRPFRARLVKVMPRTGGTGGGRGGRLSGLRDSRFVQGLQQRLPAGIVNRAKSLFRPYSGNGYQYEAAEVAACLAKGLTESPLMPLDESVDILRLADAARAEFSKG